MLAIKKNIRFFLLTILFSTGGFFYCFCQPGIEAQLASQLNTYSQQNFQEKIFAHTDRTFYVCGEIIWFKLYNVDAFLNKPLTISKVAYVELLSDDQKPVLQAKIEMNEGTGKGSFSLPFSLNSGIYILRAYTNWMKNFNPGFFFESQLTIINSLKKLKVSENDSSSGDIQFFPEGGNLVNNLESKVAFHTVEQNGKGIGCKGIIFNQRNDSITSFQSLRFGMGHFNFTPAVGDTYRAVVQTETGKIITRSLPPAYKTGYVMKLFPADTQTITVSVQSNNSNSEPVFLVAHTRQIIKLAQTKMITNGAVEFSIRKSELGEGVSHFTVFNFQRQPVCERLFFKQPEEKLNISITTSQEEYSVRNKVSIELGSYAMNMQLAKADISLSVFRIDSLQTVAESDIQSYLWLNSELSGTIEHPSYYFNTADSNVGEATDNLMLTQGWSRFKWENVLNNKKPLFQFLPEYEGTLITGKISEKATGLPSKNISTYLTVAGEKFVFKSSTSNQLGQVFFNLNKFYGNNEIIIQLGNELNESYTIDINTAFSEKVSSRKYPSLYIPEKYRDQLLSYSISTQVENSFVQEKKQRFNLPGATDTTAFYGKPDKNYLLDDYTRFITMEEVMREYVTEVRVKKLKDQFSFNVKNAPYQVFFENNPLVLLDGLPVFDINRLMAFDPLKIKKLDIITRKYFLGSDVIEGILSYGTFKGDLDGFQIDPKALVLEYPGLQLQREFYSPLYETKVQQESRLPDFRNLLFWSADIKTDEKEKRKITFFTADRPGKYAVVAQGINANGVAGSEVIFFSVKK